MPNRSIVAGESGSAGNIDELAGGGDIPTVNPFSQYAFQPISAPSAPSLLTTTLGKRRPAKGLDRQGGDTPGTELRSPSSKCLLVSGHASIYALQVQKESKYMKIYNH